MIQRLKDCWLILTGKGSVRLYDDDPWCPVEYELSEHDFWARFSPDLNDQTIEEIADSIRGS